MRKVSIRQFQRHLYSEISLLPLIVTKHHKPLFIVTLPDNNTIQTQDTSTTLDTKKIKQTIKRIESDRLSRNIDAENYF